MFVLSQTKYSVTKLFSTLKAFGYANYRVKWIEFAGPTAQGVLDLQHTGLFLFFVLGCLPTPPFPTTLDPKNSLLDASSTPP